jgi:hypothetical protein
MRFGRAEGHQGRHRTPEHAPQDAFRPKHRMVVPSGRILARESVGSRTPSHETCLAVACCPGTSSLTAAVPRRNFTGFLSDPAGQHRTPDGRAGGIVTVGISDSTRPETVPRPVVAFRFLIEEVERTARLHYDRTGTFPRSEWRKSPFVRVVIVTLLPAGALRWLDSAGPTPCLNPLVIRLANPVRPAVRREPDRGPKPRAAARRPRPTTRDRRPSTRARTERPEPTSRRSKTCRGVSSASSN